MESGSGQPPQPPKPPGGGPGGSDPPNSPEPPKPPSRPEPPKPPEPYKPPEPSKPPPEPPKAPEPGKAPGQKPSLIERIREPRIAAALGIGLAVLIILILVVSGGDDDGGSEPDRSGEAQEASVEDLQALADSSDIPVFWAGEREGQTYELTATEDGNVYIRYLGPDVEIGARDVAALTIGTYPVQDAYGALQRIAREKGSLRGKTPDGGLVVSNESNPTSVYVAYPGTDYQIEVFDPDPKVAFETATSGALERIE